MAGLFDERCGAIGQARVCMADVSMTSVPACGSASVP
jgi:hypothetical protein